jgi:hypothetical protein
MSGNNPRGEQLLVNRRCQQRLMSGRHSFQVLQQESRPLALSTPRITKPFQYASQQIVAQQLTIDGEKLGFGVTSGTIVDRPRRVAATGATRTANQCVGATGCRGGQLSSNLLHRQTTTQQRLD